MGSKAGVLCPCEKPVLASVLLSLAVAFAQRNKLAYFLAINLIRFLVAARSRLA